MTEQKWKVLSTSPDTGWPAQIEYLGVTYICPGYEEIEAMCMDGVATSVLGFTVEPDGHDHEGSPAWPLVMGVL